MSIEIKEDDLFQYLMNSDFHEEYSPEEYRFLLNKWRYYYRIIHGQHHRLKEDLDSKLKDLETEKEKCKNIVESANNQVSTIQKKLDDLYSRKLTFKERFDGKIK